MRKLRAKSWGAFMLSLLFIGIMGDLKGADTTPKAEMKITPQALDFELERKAIVEVTWDNGRYVTIATFGSHEDPRPPIKTPTLLEQSDGYAKYEIEFTRPGVAHLHATFKPKKKYEDDPGITSEVPEECVGDAKAVKVLLDWTAKGEVYIKIDGAFGRIWKSGPWSALEDIKTALAQGNYARAAALLSNMSLPLPYLDFSYNKSIVKYPVPGLKATVAVSSAPLMEPVLIKELNEFDTLYSTTTYGDEFGDLTGIKAGITYYASKYTLSGNFGFSAIEGTHPPTGAGDLMVIYFPEQSNIGKIAEETQGKKAIAIFLNNKRKLDAVDTIIKIKLVLFAGMVAALATAEKAVVLNPELIVLLPVFKSYDLVFKWYIFYLGALDLEVQKLGYPLNKMIYRDTINKIQVLPEMSPIQRSEDDSVAIWLKRVGIQN